MPDDVTTIEELKSTVARFSDERDWAQFHGAKDLAIGIATEAAELLEIFRFQPDGPPQRDCDAVARAAVAGTVLRAHASPKPTRGTANRTVRAARNPRPALTPPACAPRVRRAGPPCAGFRRGRDPRTPPTPTDALS